MRTQDMRYVTLKAQAEAKARLASHLSCALLKRVEDMSPVLMSGTPEAQQRCRKWSGCGGRCTSSARQRRRSTPCLWTARQRLRPSSPRCTLTRPRSWLGVRSTGHAGVGLPAASCNTLVDTPAG